MVTRQVARSFVEPRALRVRLARCKAGAPVLLPLAALAAAGCAREEEAPPTSVAVVDSFLAELGRLPSASLNRDQRWRMISSIWVGLPPPGYTRDSLPEAGSHSAALLQVYCVQCHWMPSPRMHAASEWPLLVRRMLLRARTVQGRLGGPLTARILGSERVLEGMAITRTPTAEQVDSLVAYLQGHALLTAEPGEIGETDEARLFADRCSVCHATPSPRAHTAAGWEQAMTRMLANMSAMGVEPPDQEEAGRILAYLKSRAAR